MKKFNANHNWDNQVFEAGKTYKLTEAQIETLSKVDIFGKPLVEGATPLIVDSNEQPVNENPGNENEEPEN